MKIGYQGIVGSNSERAAKEMVRRLGWTHVTYSPLMVSKKVVEALKSGAIDYGVMAVRNSTGGIVEETEKSIRAINWERITEVQLPIHHYLFKKSKEIEDQAITKVLSHIQALKQTKQHLAALLPQAELIPIEDTAIGAKRLKEGLIGENTAVVCSLDAGDKYQLELIAGKIEDEPDNHTEFWMIKLDEYGRNE